VTLLSPGMGSGYAGRFLAPTVLPGPDDDSEEVKDSSRIFLRLRAAGKQGGFILLGTGNRGSSSTLG
jgi:hypothetical protein